MNRILELKGLDCAACAAELEELISKVEGVSGASVDFVGQKARFFCESEEALSRVIGCCNGFEDVKVVNVISDGCGVRAAQATGEKIRIKGLCCANCARELEGMLNEVAKELPSIKEVLIDERDTYLASKIYAAPGTKKLAVIGAGHTKGVLATFEKLEANAYVASPESLEEIPPSKGFGKAVSYLIPTLIVALILYGIFANGWDQGIRTFIYWIFVNA